MAKDASLRGRAMTAARGALAAILVVGGVLVEIGWGIGSPVLRGIIPGAVSMNPTTALCFIAFGIALFWLGRPKEAGKAAVRFAIGVAALVFLVGFTRMLGLFNIVDLHTDQLIYHQTMLMVTSFSANRIAPNTALNMMLIGIDLFALVRFRRSSRFVQAVAFLVFTIAFFAVLGYAYSVTDLYGFLAYTPMALNTALGFIASSLLLFSATSDEGMVKIVLSRNTAGSLGRKFIPAIIFMPALIGWLMLQGQDLGYYNASYGVALYGIFLTVFFLLLAFTIIRSTDELDSVRAAAERDVEEGRAKLQASNKLLDAQLRDQESHNKSLQDTKAAMLNLLEDLNKEKATVEEEHAKDEAMLGSIGDAVFAIGADERIIMFNRVAASLSGYPVAEAIGKPYKEILRFVRGSGDEPEYAFVASALSGNKAEMSGDTMLVRKDGKRIAVADSAAPVMSAGAITGAVVVFRDVTHEREVDRAKTEFVSLASHQLRTPLSAIGWYAELLMDGDAGALTDKQKELLAQVRESNKRMVELVNSLLNVSRIDMGTMASDPVDTDMPALIASVASEMKPQIALKKQAFAVKYDAAAPKTYKADPQLMRIILQNLASNAVKYTPAGGSVTVAVSADAALYHISVADSGYGIPAASRAKIFTKLYRADNAREIDADGNGLGLYLVKSVIEENGGTIRFDSQEGKGTTFFIDLPIAGMKKIEGSKTLSA